MLVLPLVALLLSAATRSTPAVPAPSASVHLFRHGRAVDLDDATTTPAIRFATDLLKSSNFNTVSHADALKQSVATIQQHYRQTVAADYLVVTVETPQTLHTAGGDVAFVEIVVGLNRGDEFPSALFAIDPDGRVVAHEKYAGTLPRALRKPAPPGPVN